MIDYDTLFTEYDDSIAGEVLRDPLGLQVIWSDLGQRIFNYKLTSISNDIRNFTINLFHHYLIRDIVQRELSDLVEKRIIARQGRTGRGTIYTSKGSKGSETAHNGLIGLNYEI